RPFAQELGIHTHAEIPPRFFAGGALERRDHDGSRTAWKHRTPDDHNVPIGFVAKRGADLVSHALDVTEIQAPVRKTWCPDTDERDARRGDRLRDVGRGAQTARHHHFGHEIADAMLDNRGRAGADHVDLRAIDVDTDD